MRDVQNGARRTLVRRRSWMTAGVALALLASGCLQDGTGTGPSSGAAQLALNASIARSSESTVAVTALRVEVNYLRDGSASMSLLDQTIPLASVPPGGTVKQPVSVDLGPCLADPLHQPGGSACSVLVRVTLLGGESALDVVNIGPLTLRPGETSDPAEVTLHAASTLVVTPLSSRPLFPGETVQLTATIVDAAGGTVEGRTIEWTSNAPSVATVDGSGKVTAVAPGAASISVTGGERTTVVPVRVVARSTILIEPQAVAFEAKHSGSPPDGQNVRVVNGTTGTLEGLALGTIGYGTGASGWLSATLSGSSAPATLVLRPTRTDLAPGSYTATVPLTAPTASNSGIAVQVSYTVSAASVLVVGQTLFQVAGRFYPEPGEFRTSVTAAGPVSGLQAEVQYGPYSSGWLTARFSSDATPSELLLGISGYQFPGSYQAEVRITAPDAAQDVTVQVLWTVPQAGFFFSLEPSQECVYVQQPAYQDSVYLGASLIDSAGGTMAGSPFTVQSLTPGLTMVSATGTTYGSPAVAVRSPGFLGDARLVATLGTPPQAPGSLADTVTVRFTADYYNCYEEGSPSRASYVPGAPALHRSPVSTPSSPAPGQTAFPRARKATPASTPPSDNSRSRPTPEHN